MSHDEFDYQFKQPYEKAQKTRSESNKNSRYEKKTTLFDTL